MSRSGPANGVAALSLAHALPSSPADTIAATPSAPSASRLTDWRHRLADIDWAVDLGRDIGTRDWWRGLATLSALVTTACVAWPGLHPVAALAQPMRADDWEEARALTIMPLAMGGDTGRHMAATDAVQPLAFAPERPRVELTATVGQGDSFERVLERAGVSGGDSAAVNALIGQAIDSDAIPEGTRIDLVLGRRAVRTEPRPLESLAFRAALDLRLEITREAGALRMDRIRIAVDNTPLRIRGRVGDSLYRSARAAGAPPSAIQSYLRVIAGQLSISRDIRADDQFDIILAHRRAETGESETGSLLYAGLVRGDRPKLAMLPWTVDGTPGWYEASGVGQQRQGFAAPVNGHITSGFGMRRHPILGYVRMHAGMDIGAPYGSPVYAVSDATVLYAGYRGGYGQYIKLDLGGGMGSGYGHLSRISVSPGQRVRRGQQIGNVGSSGLSTGPHLHYELYRNGATVNPAGVSFATRPMLSGGELAAFRARIAAMQAIPMGGGARFTPAGARTAH